MGKPIRLLIANDSSEDVLLIIQELRLGGYEPVYECVNTLTELEAALGNQEWDVVVSDYLLSEINGFELLRTVLAKSSFLPVIFVSDRIDEGIVAETIRAGAEDFIFKNEIKRIVSVIERGLHWSKDHRKRVELKEAREEKIEKEIPKKHFVSIKDKVLVNYLLVLFAVFFIFGFAYWERVKEAETLSLREAKHTAEVISSGLSVAYNEKVFLPQKTFLWHQGISLLQYYVEKLSLANSYGIMVVDSNKKILAARNLSYSEKVLNYDINNEIQRTVRDGVIREFVGIDGVNGKKSRQVVVSLKSDSENIFGALIVGYDSLYEEILSQGLEDLFEVFILSFFVITLAFGLEFLNTKSILMPVVKLKEKTVLMEKGDIETPIRVSAFGEVKELAESIESVRKKSSELKQSMEFEIVERKLMEECAEHANTKLSEWISKLNKQAKEIELLNKMSEFLQSCTTKDEAFKIIHRYLKDLLFIGNGALYLLNPSRNFFEDVVVWGELFSGKETFSPNDCWAIRNLKIHFAKDSNSETRCKHLTNISGCFFCVPIMTKGELIGLLTFQPSEKCKDAEYSCESRKQLAIIATDCIALSFSNLELQDRLLQQSVRDPLTDLFNRRYMEETLGRELHFAVRNKLKVGVVMIDVDNFKHLNDAYGHRAGDKVLQDFGDFLKRNVRKEDVVCRYGGDEFVLVLPKVSPEVSNRCVEQIKEKVKHLVVHHKDQQISSLTVSLGVAVFPDDGTNWESILAAADKALYLTKQTAVNKTANTKEEAKI